jgi:protocatechuate 3,4-dioxygenase beta subunit
MQDVPEGSYAVRANKQGYRAASVMRVQAGEMTLALELEAVPKIRGIVVDRYTDQPLRRFSVQLRRADHSAETSVKVGRAVEVRSTDGRFEIDCPVAGNNAGTYLISAAAPGYAESLSDPIQVQHGADVDNVKILATPGGRISGRVVDGSGKPVARAKVTSRSNEWTGGPFDQVLGDSFPGVATVRSVRTNDKGEFTLPNLTATTYLIKIEPMEHAQRAVKAIEVTDGKDTKVGDVLVNVGATVSGTVRGPSGKVLAGASVSLIGEQLGQEFAMQLNAKTDINGRYEIQHINPGAYFIAASRPAVGGGDPFGQANDHRKTRRRITLDEGRTYPAEDFELPN